MARMRTLETQGRYYADIDDLITMCAMLGGQPINTEKFIEQLVEWKEGLREAKNV